VVWLFLRSLLHRGWWLVTSLYLVIEAELTPFQLVFLGTAQGLTVVAAEVPTGVIADTYSRKWSIVIGHGVMGLGMLSTGLVTSFPALILTQMTWGLSWTFSSGADVAWLTDELRHPNRTAQVLASSSVWGQVGSAIGILAFGILGSTLGLADAIVIAGGGMWILGVAVTIGFPEQHFARHGRTHVPKSAITTLRDGFSRVRALRILMLLLLCTFLVNGADEAFGRLYTKHLIDLGFPGNTEAIAWLTALSVSALILGAIALAILTRFLMGRPRYATLYALGAGVGVLGLVLFATAPGVEMAMVGVLAVTGVATTVMRAISSIWANEHAASDVRATVQSFLSLAENSGEIALGFSLAVVAELFGIDETVIAAAVILSVTMYLVITQGQTK
jgi:MFS family permease